MKPWARPCPISSSHTQYGAAIRRAGQAAALWAGLVLAAPAAADPGAFELEVPVRCAMGGTCFVQNYVDADAGKSWRDHRCGPYSYDGHKGTDIRVPDLAAMRRGVVVTAAADGVVRAVRDGMPDLGIRRQSPGAVTGREAGNAVVLVHSGGWETQYSHLRRGSVAVQPGDRVAAGQPLGQIGLSGHTEFPHLHFEVRFGGRSVDPFVGLDDPPGCGQAGRPLWSSTARKMLAYRQGEVLAAGFTHVVPSAETMFEGLPAPDVLPSTAPALIFWSSAIGLLADDREMLQVIGPDGTVVAEAANALDRPKAAQWRFVGKKAPATGWAPGRYTGRYRLLRGGTVVFALEKSVVIR